MGDAACVRRCQVVSCWRERPGSLPNMSRDQGIRGYLPGNILDMIVTIVLTLRLCHLVTLGCSGFGTMMFSEAE
ncbi:hypothetical protein BDQ94DRAFT_133493 [Aspergillus welwitschiae]|uniref:Uncharacterized protein n=1 Tax=Aspergillus welwitschiae TaxID=1341132 RepID=A0A3F3QK11_9EURO|nr:hypothetical protein BDQ94DRAFT_133493 [Aspergillus welwitschiae]RDH39684.1 hypothetical protein BDQ94DRAFT_133493 [Aspergillus welwitschiae]